MQVQVQVQVQVRVQVQLQVHLHLQVQVHLVGKNIVSAFSENWVPEIKKKEGKGIWVTLQCRN